MDDTIIGSVLFIKETLPKVSQSEKAKNCCVVPKIEELQSLVFLQMGGASQQWRSAGREILDPKLSGRWIVRDASISRLPPSLTLPLRKFFWSYMKDKCT